MNNKHCRPPDGTWPLSPRELEVLIWAAKGKTYAETGLILGISHASIHTYMKSMQLKLNATNITHAVAVGYELGIIKHNTVELVPFYRVPEELLVVKEHVL
jgi:DNA-binding CsgD family transcriptional regulator